MDIKTPIGYRRSEMSIVLCIGLHHVLGNNKLEFLHLKLDSDFTLMVVWDNFGGVGVFLLVSLSSSFFWWLLNL
jgi:hypothetical protein